MPYNIRNITEQDYTSLHLAANEASQRAQKYYINIVAIDLIGMIVASTFAAYNYQLIQSKQSLYIISCFCMLLSLILTIVLLSKKYEDIWYQGRALAESCKTLTWRFMMQSELFEHTLDKDEAKAKFVNRIKELSQEFVELNKVLNTSLINKPIVTSHMIDVRCLSLLDRKKYYIVNRIEDQKNWYSDKATLNVDKYNLWFAIIILSQILSLSSVIFLIIKPESNWNLIGLLTTISSASLSWLQLKKHQELKQAYTTATQELNSISSLSDSIINENDFSRFVLDAENAISREHTLWLAQRRK